MIPTIALVGRPNVGKSTLFNRLTKTRNALVADFPGLTRDRQYGQAKWRDLPFILIDTGGLEGAESGVDEKMAQQSMQAAVEADIVFFLVDAKSGLTSADEWIARSLRHLHKSVYLLANKTDGLDANSAVAEFYQLGVQNVYQIAATQGHGIQRLLEDVLFERLEAYRTNNLDYLLEQHPPVEVKKDYSTLPVKMAIIGRPNVGKSTLTNRILGEERVVVYDLPGTTRDSVYIPFERHEKSYVVIDTAGVRRRKNMHQTIEKFSVVKTLQAIEDANVVLLMVDAQQELCDQDLTLLGHVLHAGRSVVVVVNKWDGLEQDARNQIKRELDRRLGFVDFARIHFISALHGSGVGQLFDAVQEAFASATQRTNTATLTRLMQSALADHPPPMAGGRRIKLKYAHAGGYNPPRIVIHGNRTKALPDSYKRYLVNYFRKSLKIIGTPIHLEFQDSENPYAACKNKLTDSQRRKKKRLMKFVKKR